ncbi:MAG TPA: hypothetical protein DCE41_17090 [Cytophagales bacterium]|nr:hypothetical protein [Cytophagales bacterium]HAP59208.1 hypothetical protein [Cytophagales bacterium]
MIFFGLLFLAFLPVVGIALSKAIGLTPNRVWTWLYAADKIPWTGAPIEYVGLTMMVLVLGLIAYIVLWYLLKGLTFRLDYDEGSHTLTIYRNGLRNRITFLPFDAVEKFTKQRHQGAKTGSPPTMHLYAIKKADGKFVKLLAEHDQAKANACYKALIERWKAYKK